MLDDFLGVVEEVVTTDCDLFVCAEAGTSSCQWLGYDFPLSRERTSSGLKPVAWNLS